MLGKKLASCKILMRMVVVITTVVAVGLLQSYLKAIVSPTAKLHYASLLIEGEVCDVDGARALQSSNE